jgi:hypothetical protein
MIRKLQPWISPFYTPAVAVIAFVAVSLIFREPDDGIARTFWENKVPG